MALRDNPDLCTACLRYCRMPPYDLCGPCRFFRMHWIARAIARRDGGDPQEIMDALFLADLEQNFGWSLRWSGM